MMAHAWIGTKYMYAVENYMRDNTGKGLTLAWAGDYGAPEPDINLYHKCDELPELKIDDYSTAFTDNYKYIVNHDKKVFVNKMKTQGRDEGCNAGYMIHPLPLLTYESAGGGGGDYCGHNECDLGLWARCCLTIEADCPGDDYTEYVSEFREE